MVAVRHEGRVSMFSLDCSNFDLTQHNTVTESVHLELRDVLRQIDDVAADLWFALMRERVVVVAGRLVRRFKHAGASGMPLQSKVNDMLMDVMIRRLEKEFKSGAWRYYGLESEVRLGLDIRPEDMLEYGEGAVGRMVEKVGAGMGFKVRLEDWQDGGAGTIEEALSKRPFKFIGYHFYCQDGQVRVYADAPRAIAQLRYPNLRYVNKKEELAVMEAIKNGSIVMNMGVPPPELRGLHEGLLDAAVALLRSELAKNVVQIEEPRLRTALQDSEFGFHIIPSMKGLLKALLRDPEELWGTKERERDDMEVSGAGRRRRGEMIPSVPAKTHPVTRANDGRVAPTVVWGPNKLPREHDELMDKHRKLMKRLGAGKPGPKGLMLPDSEDELDDVVADDPYEWM